MKNNPNIIRSITVSYYRSINKQRIRNVMPLNIVTGGNDAGKSNLLRALNLFFTERDEFGNDFNFEREFSKNRLQTVRAESVKGKQFIKIDVEFNCANAFPKTLPDRVTVTKKWSRDSKVPTVTNNLQSHIDRGKLNTTIRKAEGSLSRFLGAIEFHYIPAIKDNLIFQKN